MDDLLIRAVEPDDLDQLHALYSAPSIVLQTLNVPLLPRASFARRVEKRENVHALVACVGEIIVGDVSLVIYTRPRRRHCGGIGLSVHADYRRRGIGRKLMDTILDIGFNWYNLTRIELEVFTDNAPAVQLYTTLGFETEGTLRCYAMRDGKLADVHTMALIRA